MQIIIVYDSGWACDNDSMIDTTILGQDEKGMHIERHIIPKELFVYSGEPTKECQVIDDNNKGYFCIFESNQKLKIIGNMSNDEIQQLKNNLKKWQIN